MFFKIFRFEIRYQVRQPLLWLVTLLFALLTFSAVTSDAVRLGGGIGNVHRNAPSVILNLLSVMTILGMFAITAFVASAAIRDFEHDTAALFFSKPIRKFDYLAGRFAGSLTASLGVFVGAALGILIGSWMPWIEAERLGRFALAPYAYAFLVIILPNVLFLGAVFFTLASLSRSVLFTYMGVVFAFVLFGISGILLGDLDNQALASLLDPFGNASLNLVTRYWTPLEKNTALPALWSNLGLNRLLWIAVALLVFAANLALFNPAKSGLRRKRPKLAEPQPEEDEEEALGRASSGGALPRAAQSFSGAASFRLFLKQARLETIGVLKSVLFLVLLAFGLTNFLASAALSDEIFGTSVYPVTRNMLQYLAGTFSFLLIIIVTFYAGELFWKERSHKLNEVYDALPVPTWVPFAAKLAAIAGIVLTFEAVGVLAAMGFQLSKGYTRFEPLLYVKGVFVESSFFLLTAVLAICLQAFTNSKFLGYLVMILYMVSRAVLNLLSFNHVLYRYGSTPSASPETLYSDMNGYGHFVAGFLWLNLYWALFAAFLFALALLLKARGTEDRWQIRWRIAKERFRGPVATALVAALLGFVAVGIWIFYNTNVRNQYLPEDKQKDRQADYEKKYRKYKDAPLPRITDVKVDVDLYPEERRMAARGHYLLANKTDKPIDTLYVNLPPRITVNSLAFRDHQRTLFDRQQGFSIYKLKAPLAPGETMPFDFSLEVKNPGFPNGNSDTSLVYNGTFFNNRQYFPVFGYAEERQLLDRNDRRKRGLPPVLRMAKVDDLFARRNTYIAKDSDWIRFAATVSTSPDQIAIAPGYLQREWTANGRRYFQYQMDAPILHFYSFLSAAYQVKRDRWNDVAIEIYYSAPHAYNVDRMIASIKKSLDYYTRNFGPYQHRQVRILEFPRYAQFAQSFPNTIPYSEGLGFIARLKEDPEAIDYVFYVTAHEVAHQWWAHQVIGGDVQGSTMLSETLAQYSALMVMEKEYGPEKMRRFLKYELDNYLRGRSTELLEEEPLMLVENQPYIHYRKGSVVMYALKDAIGEEAVNRALASYVREVKFQQPPFTHTPDLMRHFYEVTPPDKRYILKDLFETITLFENRATEAVWRKRADGKYDVDLTVEAKKVRADGKGVETPTTLDDWIDIGVFGKEKKGRKEEETVLYLEKHRLTQPKTTFHLVVDKPPVEAGIDPLNKLVDRDSKDNRKKVTAAAAAGKAAAPVG
jgi:ABC-2 type transport system permease protein